MRAIARAAGVSHTTVSFVLNDRGDEKGIPAATQQRVRSIAQQLDYRPNPIAHALQGRRTRTLGVLWSLGGPHDAEGMIRMIALDAQRRGYVPYLADNLGAADMVRRALIDFRQRSVDAVVVEAPPYLVGDPQIIELCRQFDAGLLITTEPVALPLDQIVHDRYTAVRQIAEHLVCSGRQRIVYLATSSNQGKFDVLAQACQAKGLAADRVRFLEVDNHVLLRDEAGWRRVLAQAFEDRPASSWPDAVVASSDEVAAYALQYLADRGLRVPDDVAVVGFNNAFLSRAVNPPLASVHRFHEDLARAIDDLLYDRLDHMDQPPRTRSIPMQFIWRPSAGGSCPPACRERKEPCL